MMTRYGRKGGDGPNRGKVATRWRVTLPDGREVIKRTFRHGDVPATAIATGFMHNGKPVITVWMHAPAWEGEFGRLVATRIEE